MTREQLNLWKAQVAAFAEIVQQEAGPSSFRSITERECVIEIALRIAFNAGLEAACATTDDIRPYDDIRRVSKVIRTDRMEEASLGVFFVNGDPLAKFSVTRKA